MKKSDLPKNVVDIEFANRGPIVILADKIEGDIKAGKGGYKFKKVLRCNIGNPQAVGMKPFTYLRETLALTAAPHLLENEKMMQMFKPDVVERARWYHNVATNGVGIGAYAPSPGYHPIRKSICEFIDRRDAVNSARSGIASNRGLAMPAARPDDIIMTNGATTAISYLLTLCLADTDFKPSLMVGIPLYPVYSARATLYKAHIAPYYLTEQNNWNISIAELDRDFKRARSYGHNIKAIEVISPGNPSATILPRERIREIIAWALKHDIAIFADEVYQDLVFSDAGFHSFREVLWSEFDPDTARKCRLVSFHSVSKTVGECGLRGGYAHCENIHDSVMAQFLKLASINLCANTAGIIAFDLMVNPPKMGKPSYELYKKEWDTWFGSLKRRAKLVAEGLNNIPGVRCSKVEGAMYAYPRISLPKKFCIEAKNCGRKPDFHFCVKCLERHGIVVVAGSGFGQLPGTLHFRTTILLPEEDMKTMVAGIAETMSWITRTYGALPEMRWDNLVSKL